LTSTLNDLLINTNQTLPVSYQRTYINGHKWLLIWMTALGISRFTNMTSSMHASLIAPCGMNCAICSGHLREKKQCPGCNGDDLQKPKYCVNCRIKYCEMLENIQSKLCVDCDKFPCSRLKRLDKRYRNRYHMSMIDNLGEIKNAGMNAFLEHEQTRWICPQCGGIICVHKGCCYQCGAKLESD